MRLLDMARLACYNVLYISLLTFIYHCATFNFLSLPSHAASVAYPERTTLCECLTATPVLSYLFHDYTDGDV